MSLSAVTLAPEALEALAAALARPAVERLALTPAEAAEAIGVGRSFFDERVKPELRVIRRGKLVLIPRRELERWVEESAARTLE